MISKVHVLNHYVISEIHFQVYLVFNPGQNILGHVIKLGVRTNFAKLAHLVPLIMLVIIISNSNLIFALILPVGYL